jgi:hypothetical protein
MIFIIKTFLCKTLFVVLRIQERAMATVQNPTTVYIWQL